MFYPFSSISRNKHYLGVHDTSVESGKFPAEGLLHKSERDLVPRVHNILVLGHGRIRLRKYHLQKKVRVFVISFVESFELYRINIFVHSFVRCSDV